MIPTPLHPYHLLGLSALDLLSCLEKGGAEGWKIGGLTCLTLLRKLAASHGSTLR